MRTAASVSPVKYIVALIGPTLSEANGENWTDSVQVPFAAMISPVQLSATTEKLKSESAATGETAGLVDVNGNALATPINIGSGELFVSVSCTGLDVLPTAIAGENPMEEGLTPMLPGLVGVVPGATNINVP